MPHTNKWLLLQVLKFHTSNLKKDTYNVSTYKPKIQNDLIGKVSSTGPSRFRTKVTDCSRTQTCIQLSFYLLKYIAKSQLYSRQNKPHIHFRKVLFVSLNQRPPLVFEKSHTQYTMQMKAVSIFYLRPSETKRILCSIPVARNSIRDNA